METGVTNLSHTSKAVLGFLDDLWRKRHIKPKQISCTFCFMTWLSAAFENQVPNGIGTVLGVIQLVLYYYYYYYSNAYGGGSTEPLLESYVWVILFCYIYRSIDRPLWLVFSISNYIRKLGLKSVGFREINRQSLLLRILRFRSILMLDFIEYTCDWSDGCLCLRSFSINLSEEF